uniref:Phospho-N-acetylmuramoyl-pentapeptide-transferase n=1 Tax=candidate division WOR-3 bacterium TaxID=2052148 RepID=A0A7C3N5L6_UNCW3
MISSILSSIFKDVALFKYITFRAAMSSITSLLFIFIFGRSLVNLLKKFSLTEKIRDDGPKQHLKKEGTPTMGGIIIVLSIFLGTLLWADLSNTFIRFMLIATSLFFILGFTDDILKFKSKKGLIPKYKLIFQFIISIIIFYFITKNSNYSNFRYLTNILFIKNILFDLSFLYLPFIILVLLGTTNAVNLTDGLDGLASGMLAIVFTLFAIVTYIMGNKVFSDYLNILFIKNIGELSVFSLTCASASLGFLWFNSYPAEVFMGDSGSITLGGILATIAILSKQEILLLIGGGLFAVEALSSLIQIYYFKLTKGKRFFKMAPLHHHFELSGMSEPKIVIRFWIVTILLVIIALSTLKVR